MVKEHVRSRLDTLSDLASQLNKASDKYTAELKAIEAKLLSLNLGLEVVLSLPIKELPWEIRAFSAGDDEVSWRRYKTKFHLGYAKHKDEVWRLVIRKYEVVEAAALMEDEIGETLINEIPLLEASRELRIAAADQIPDLLRVLEETTTETLDALKKVSDIERKGDTVPIANLLIDIDREERNRTSKT